MFSTPSFPYTPRRSLEVVVGLSPPPHGPCHANNPVLEWCTQKVRVRQAVVSPLSVHTSPTTFLTPTRPTTCERPAIYRSSVHEGSSSTSELSQPFPFSFVRTHPHHYTHPHTPHDLRTARCRSSLHKGSKLRHHKEGGETVIGRH